jgi:hypothetical protein
MAGLIKQMALFFVFPASRVDNIQKSDTFADD